MNRHKFWFFIFSAFSGVYSLAVVVFLGLAADFAIQGQATISAAMICFALMCVVGALGYYQWANQERDKYF